MDLSTNIIRNVYNIGTNSCDAGTQYCTDEYALYFPCLKNITRGQKVCFDFYIANGTTRDVVDLRTVDAISLNLNGQFNCSYGTFSYPDNIFSLQTENYPVIYHDDFGERELCHLDLVMIDTEKTDLKDKSVEMYSDCGDFYSGTKVDVEAKDTPTHIFLGWALVDENDEICSDDTWEDYVISTSKTYSFIIKEDITIYALYRERKQFKVISDPQNKSSHFVVNYNHISKNISNRDEDGFDDSYYNPDYQYDYIDVLEGYYMAVTCVPSVDIYDSASNPDNDTTYVFERWKDCNTSRCRLFKIGVDTEVFEDGDKIKLRAYCSGPVPYFEQEDEVIDYEDDVDEDGIHILTEFNEVDIYDFYGDGKYIKSTDDVYQKFIDEEGYLYFNSGTLILSSFDIEDGIKINIKAKADDNDESSDVCELHIKVNGYEINQELSQDEFKEYEFYFSKCDKSDIEISVDGECLIDNIKVCKEELINAGKAQFCLNPEDTSNIPPGPLNVSGAIAVGELGVDTNGELTVKDAQAYGLATTPIGQVNKLPKITLNIE